VNPDQFAELMALAQRDVDDRWELYQDFTEIDRVSAEDEEEEEE
jgi:hypothetical protein